MFQGTLYNSQKDAANLLCQKKFALLAWEQGCGKTVISIAAAEKLLELQYVKSVLIICPSHLCFQWEEKINEFSTSSSTTITAKARRLREYVLNEEASYTIVSYALFRRDFDKIKRRNWDLIICDEAQEFKNNKSKTAKLIKQLNVENSSSYRWALTGTAISNKLEELYSIFYWIDRQFLPSWPQFEKLHIVRSRHTNQIQRYKNLQLLNDHLIKRMHRRTQNDLKGELPKVIEQTYYLEKTKEYKESEDVLLKALEELSDKLQALIFSDKNLDRSIRDSATSSALHAVRGELAWGSKLSVCSNLVTSLLEENLENKIVVFSFYKEPLYDLHCKFKQKASLYTGDLTNKEKNASIKSFRGTSRILLCSDAGSTGLDLPDGNFVIHLDVPYSWGKLDQRNKRITRISSKFDHNVVIYLLIKNSLEEYFFNALQKKKELAAAVYQGDKEEVVVKTKSLKKYLEEARQKD